MIEKSSICCPQCSKYLTSLGNFGSPLPKSSRDSLKTGTTYRCENEKCKLWNKPFTMSNA